MVERYYLTKASRSHGLNRFCTTLQATSISHCLKYIKTPYLSMNIENDKKTVGQAKFSKAIALEKLRLE